MADDAGMLCFKILSQVLKVNMNLFTKQNGGWKVKYILNNLIISLEYTFPFLCPFYRNQKSKTTFQKNGRSFVLCKTSIDL